MVESERWRVSMNERRQRIEPMRVLRLVNPASLQTFTVLSRRRVSPAACRRD